METITHDYAVAGFTYRNGVNYQKRRPAIPIAAAALAASCKELAGGSLLLFSLFRSTAFSLPGFILLWIKRAGYASSRLFSGSFTRAFIVKLSLIYLESTPTIYHFIFILF